MILELSTAAFLLGGVFVALYLPLAAAPAAARRLLARFPRDRWAAWALTAVDLAWAAWLLNQTPLGRFEAAKDYLPVIVPAAFFAVVFLMDELLAARALGGLLILVPAPILDAARWHGSPLRLVMTIVAYGLAVQGILLVLSPYKFRKSVERWAGSDRRCRLLGVGGAVLGLVLVLLGLTVY